MTDLLRIPCLSCEGHVVAEEVPDAWDEPGYIDADECPDCGGELDFDRADPVTREELRAELDPDV